MFVSKMAVQGLEGIFQGSDVLCVNISTDGGVTEASISDWENSW
jgi:hypothetical protein